MTGLAARTIQSILVVTSNTGTVTTIGDTIDRTGQARSPTAASLTGILTCLAELIHPIVIVPLIADTGRCSRV